MPTLPCLSERAIANIEALCRTIRITGGFETDAGKTVYRSKQSIDKGQTPCCNIWEGTEQPDPTTRGQDKRSIKLIINIEGHIEAGKDFTGAMLGKIKADIKRAICGGSHNSGLPDPPNPRSFATIYYEGSAPLPRPDGANTEAVVVTFLLIYPEKTGDPYTSG